MFNFVSLTVKCPQCGELLMDEEQLVDNESSIKLFVDTGKVHGTIRLSSIYGSYNFLSDVDIPEDEVAKFICPKCKHEILSEDHCKVCNAPMIDFILDMGGKISVCSRRGCKNHAVEFEDLTNALRKFYQEYGYNSKQETLEPAHSFETIHLEKTEEEENKEIIESGAFLQAYCPHCKRTLIDADMLKLKIINDKDEEGYVMLSPFLNVFSSKSTVFLIEDKPVKDLKCIHCDESLMVEDKSCEKCESHVARISISARLRLIDFYICSKKGCRWHGLSEEDINEIKLEDSNEW
jgi:Zn finger protein HypA/HybF involved in hydrogenase expression